MDRPPDSERLPDAPRDGPIFDRTVRPLLIAAGLASVLVVPGRRSGAPREVTIIVMAIEGTRYLLATRGLAHWALNLRAAGRASLRRRGKVEEIETTEIHGEEYDRVIAAFRRVAPPPARRYFERDPDPAAHPAFRIKPIERDPALAGG